MRDYFESWVAEAGIAISLLISLTLVGVTCSYTLWYLMDQWWRRLSMVTQYILWVRFKKFKEGTIVPTQDIDRIMEKVVDKLDGRYEIRFAGTPDFLAEELVRLFNLPKTQAEHAKRHDYRLDRSNYLNIKPGWKDE